MYLNVPQDDSAINARRGSEQYHFHEIRYDAVVGLLTALGRKAVQDCKLSTVHGPRTRFGVRFFFHGFDIGDGLLDRQPRCRHSPADRESVE